MKVLNYDQAHKYVEDQQAKGRKVFWDGWKIITFTPTPSCLFRTDARFIDGQWGIAKSYPPNSDGKWRVG